MTVENLLSAEDYIYSLGLLFTEIQTINEIRCRNLQRNGPPRQLTFVKATSMWKYLSNANVNEVDAKYDMSKTIYRDTSLFP